MNIEDLLIVIEQKKIKISVVDGKLRVRAPEGVLTQALAKALKENKSQLLHDFADTKPKNFQSRVNEILHIKPEMLTLVNLEQSQIDAIVNSVPNGASNIQDIYPLAPLQEGMLFQHLIQSTGDAYLNPTLLAFDDEIALKSFVDAANKVVARHDILRTAIFWEHTDEAVQVVFRSADFVVETLNFEPILSGCANSDVASQLLSHANPEQYRLDIRSAPMIKGFASFDSENNRWLLLFLYHHLILDHTSLQFFIEEVSQIQQGHEADLTEPVPFRNFVAQTRLGVSQQEHKKFFTEMLGDIDEPTLPFGLVNQQGYSAQVNDFEMKVDQVLVRRIREQSKKQGVSVASLFHVIWAQVLSKTSNQDNVMFGTVLFGRFQGGAGSDQALGMFINTLPMRVNTAISVKECLKQTHLTLTQLLKHEHASLVLAQGCSNLPSSIPLFSSYLNYRYSPEEGAIENSLERAKIINVDARSNLPFGLHVDDSGSGISLTLQIDESISAERMCQYTLVALESVIEILEQDVSTSMKQVNIVPQTEITKLVSDFNDNQSDFPSNRLVHELFEENVIELPNAIALETEERTLTYAQLNERANQLAQYLVNSKVKPGDNVALCFERSFEFVISTLAILKIGGTYVPIEVECPHERLLFILNDCEASCLLTLSNSLLQQLPSTLIRIDLDLFEQELLEQDQLEELNSDNSNLTNESSFDLLEPSEKQPSLAESSLERSSNKVAYIMYTSGSTGVPKGVEILHRGVVSLVVNNGFADFNCNDRFALASNLAFDASTLELWGALLSGARCVICSRDDVLNLEHFKSRLEHHNVNILWLSVGLFNQYASGLSKVFRKLRYLMVGGDVLNPDIISSVLTNSPPKHLLNGYGPTETTTFATTYEITYEASCKASIPIGYPIANHQIYILDDSHQLSPLGVIGEIYIGGAGVARGYLNNPDLTNKHFLRDPFCANGDSLMYKTGDLGRWREDGAVEFLGRNDFQVKIRGFRIELGEIVSALSKVEGIDKATVIAREDNPGDKKIVAYYLKDDAYESLDPLTIQGDLGKHLPEYMIPVAYVSMSTFPLTSNGKLDVSKFPIPDDEAFVQRTYEKPLGAIEELISEIWSQLLLVKNVGRFDNFFLLGGHSLLAIQLISQLRQQLKIEVPLNILFSNPVLADFSEAVEAQEKCSSGAIGLADRTKPVLLSYSQQRLWFIDQMDKQASTAYHIPGGLRLTGNLNKAALIKSLNRIMQRHEVLRTRFVSIDGQCTQIIDNNVDLEMDYIEVNRNEYDIICKQEAEKHFNLEKGPLIRGQLLTLDINEHVLLITMHHIISDGWSVGLFLDELSALYVAFNLDKPDPLPALSIQYADFAQWQQQASLTQQQEYWLEQLKGANELVSLPYDHVRPEIQDYKGASIDVTLTKELTKQLKLVSQTNGVTLYMTLLAGWAAVISRISSQNDVVIGSPNANRNRVELESLIGLFVNSQPMRVDLTGEPSVTQLLTQVKKTALAAQSNQDIPFEKIVESLNPVRSLSHSPIFQLMLTWHNTPKSLVELEGLLIEEVDLDNHMSPFDLSLDLLETDGQIVGRLNFATALFNQESIEQHWCYFERMLSGMVQDPLQAIGKISILSETERAQQLIEFNSLNIQYNGVKSIQGRFESQVNETPDAVAAVFDNETKRQLMTYSQLNQRANQISSFLSVQGVESNSLVGIYAERSIDFLVAILATLKAGAGYVPLDPSNPKERLDYMLADSEVSVVLSQTKLRDRLKYPENCEAFYLDEFEKFESYSKDNPNCQTQSNDLAYMIYTSGSTGVPKGALVHHAGALNHIDAEFDLLGRIENGKLLATNFLQSAASSSDVSVWQFLAPVVSGGKTVILDDMTNLPKCIELMQTEQVHLIQAAPVVLQMLLEYLMSLPRNKSALPNLLWLMTIAEACPVSLINRWFSLYPQVPIMNGFGPSEASDDITYHIMRTPLPANCLNVPIGKPIPNMTMYVLDQYQQLLPLGVVGELCVAGVGVGPGYWKDSTRTEKSFVANPFINDKGSHGERLYRTGDLGRWNHDGSLEFIGRIDNQVKVRGFRIELGEIEAALATIQEVGDVAVIISKNKFDENTLHAYLACKQQEKMSTSELRAKLSEKLPDYMIPSSFTWLDKMPLNAADKIDRQRLPKPAMQLDLEQYLAPSTEAEKQLVTIWAILLDCDESKIGISANFFELGGHSLLVTRLISKIHQQMNVALSVKDIFDQPIISVLAQTVENSKVLLSVKENSKNAIIKSEGIL